MSCLQLHNVHKCDWTNSYTGSATETVMVHVYKNGVVELQPVVSPHTHLVKLLRDFLRKYFTGPDLDQGMSLDDVYTVNI